MESFKTEMEKELDIKVVITDSNKEAAKGADIIYTATQADEPLLMNDWIKRSYSSYSWLLPGTRRRVHFKCR